MAGMKLLLVDDLDDAAKEILRRAATGGELLRNQVLIVDSLTKHARDERLKIEISETFARQIAVPSRRAKGPKTSSLAYPSRRGRR